MRVGFHGLKLDLIPEWLDITDDLPNGSPPSLARQDGIGALQFSVAKYRSGERPEVTLISLRGLIEDFFRSRSLPIDNLMEQGGNPLLVTATTVTSDEVIAVWFLSNGLDIALVTYVGADPESIASSRELTEVKSIVESAEFL